MSEYHKIQTIFKRDMANKGKMLLEGQWTFPEFEYLADNIWVFTEKVDGTNTRVIYRNGSIEFGGRSEGSQIPAKLVTRLNEVFLPLQSRFAEIFGDAEVILYGEGHGAGIQKGGENYRENQDFVLFDVRVGPWWLSRDNVEDVARKLEIGVVPVIGEGTLHDAVRLAKAGIKSVWGDFEAEGIVARPKVELCTRNGQRIITKIKCRDFAEFNERKRAGK